MPKPGPNMTLGVLIFLVVFGLSAGGLYALDDLVQPPKSEAVIEDGDAFPGGPTNLRIVAKNLAFDKTSIPASTNSSVTITLDNQDAGVAHNIAFYTNNRATTKIAVGNLITGPGTEDIKFNAPASAGTYFFRCDAHPDQMKGALVVK